nr:hypothetical protein [Tanacetum cinerariifolium]
IKNMMASLLQMNTASTSGSGSLSGNTVANPEGELKAITTSSGLVTDGPTIPTPLKSVTPEEDECVEETYTDPDLAEYTIKVPPPPVQKPKPPVQRNFVFHTRDSPLSNFPYPSRMLKQKQQEKDEIQIQKFWHMFKQIHLNITLVEALEFTDELALITYPLDYDDNLKCDIEFDLREIEFLLYQGKGSGLKDSIDQTDLANLNDYFVDPTPEMFTDEHAPDYSFPPRLDVDDDLPSPNNEDKVFNPGILIHEKSVKIITRVAQEKKLPISYASLVFEDVDPPFYEPLVFKDVPNSMRLLPFSSKNEEKVFKPGIYTFEKVHFCFLPELSHLGYHVFKVNLIFINLMRIVHVQSGKNTPLLDVLLFYFYPS